MSATKAQINWSSVAYNSNPLTRITAGGFGTGGQLVKFKGDTDLYNSVVACPTIEPHASFTSADIGTFMLLFPGTLATLTATLKDARSQSGGDVNFTMGNAVFENADSQAQHAQFGTVTGTWVAMAPDGLTPPLGLTRS
jgi:hypothetical protein